MKTSLLALLFVGSATLAFGAGATDEVALPEMKAVDSWSYVTDRVLPAYPLQLRRSGETGRVSLDIAIDERGRVKSVTVLDSDNNALSDAAREAVRRWRFVPDENRASRELRRARVTFSFELNEAA